MTLGVRFEETMRGHLQPLGGGQARAMELRAHVHAPGLLEVWRRAPMPLRGQVSIEGLFERAPTSGSIQLELRGLHRVTYDLSWRHEGSPLGRFYGWKTLSLRHLVRGWTELRGKVTYDGALLGDAVLHFDLKALPAFVRSMRPT